MRFSCQLTLSYPRMISSLADTWYGALQDVVWSSSFSLRSTQAHQWPYEWRCNVQWFFSWPYFHLLTPLVPGACWLWGVRLTHSKLDFKKINQKIPAQTGLDAGKESGVNENKTISVLQWGNICTDRHKNGESSWTLQEDRKSIFFH